MPRFFQKTMCFAPIFFFAVLAGKAQVHLFARLPQAKTQAKTPPGIAEKFARHRHFTIADGLPDNTIRAMAEAPDGFLWLGTEQGGLVRFDGKDFTVFSGQADGTGPLPSNTASSLVVIEEQNRLLVGTAHGLVSVDLKTLEFSPVPLPARPGLAEFDNMILRLHRARNGKIWVGTRTAMFVLEAATLRCEHRFFRENGAPLPGVSFFVRNIYELPDGTVIFNGTIPGATARFWTIDFSKNRLDTLAQLRPELAVLDAFQKDFQLEIKPDAIWLGELKIEGSPMFHRFDWATKKLLSLGQRPPSDGVGYMQTAVLPDSLVLLSTFFGRPRVFDLRTGQSDTLGLWTTSWPDGKGLLTFTDRRGNVWVSPRLGGLYFFPMRPQPATPLTELNRFHEKKAVEWFGFGGLNFQGKWWLTSPNGGFFGVNPATQQAEISGEKSPLDYSVSLLPLGGDTIWSEKLTWLKTSNLQTGRMPTPGLSPEIKNLFFLQRDSRGLVWGGVPRNGVACFDPKTRRFTHFKPQTAGGTFPMLWATTMAEDAAGDLWFGFGRGNFLTKWTRATGRFDSVFFKTPSLFNPAAPLQLAFESSGKHIWSLTFAALSRIDPATGAVEIFGKQQGLATDIVREMAFDRDGQLWLATPAGLHNLYGDFAKSPHTLAVRRFRRADGLPSDDVVGVSLLDTARNILLVTTAHGLCLFEPGKIAANAEPPRMQITEIRASGHVVLPSVAGFVSLPFGQNDLSISFTGINFYDGEQNRYQYRLDGGDDDWVEANGSKSATYLNLQPGHYTFRARAANGDGRWSEAEARLVVTVRPPFWATWAFRLAAFAALSGGVFWWNRRNLRRERARAEEKLKVQTQLAELEMKALRAQMNPHFVFNALSSVQNFVMKNDVREASRYLSKFARLMRLILENSESPLVVLSREIEMLRSYTEMEAMRFSQQFSFDFQIDTKLETEKISVPGMLVQPHIENAIWHGLMHRPTPGHLWVRFLKPNGGDWLVCEIEDDGIGRERARAIAQEQHGRHGHRSTGLANVRQRLELLDKRAAGDFSLEIHDLTDANGMAAGTRVVLRMPFFDLTPSPSPKEREA